MFPGKSLFTLPVTTACGDCPCNDRQIWFAESALKCLTDTSKELEEWK